MEIHLGVMISQNKGRSINSEHANKSKTLIATTGMSANVIVMKTPTRYNLKSK